MNNTCTHFHCHWQRSAIFDSKGEFATVTRCDIARSNHESASKRGCSWLEIHSNIVRHIHLLHGSHKQILTRFYSIGSFLAFVEFSNFLDVWRLPLCFS